MQQGQSHLKEDHTAHMQRHRGLQSFLVCTVAKLLPAEKKRLGGEADRVEIDQPHPPIRRHVHIKCICSSMLVQIQSLSEDTCLRDEVKAFVLWCPQPLVLSRMSASACGGFLSSST